jgi:hypothetical protein
MRSRTAPASIPAACLLVLGVLAGPPAANAESGGVSLHKRGKIAGPNARLRSKGPVRRVRIHLPMGPSQVYNDYPYYYSRGYYPTHIGGYVYYPYSYYRRYCWGYGRGPVGFCGPGARGH